MTPPPPRIGKRKPPHVYAHQWIQRTGLSHKQVAERMETSEGTLSKLLSGKMKWTLSYLEALRHAVDAEEVQDLHRPPESASLDAMLRPLPEQRRQDILRMVEALIKAG